MADNVETKDNGNEDITLPQYILDMQEELAALKGKVEKAQQFLESKEFTALDDYRKALFAAQVGAMQSYANVLSIRIMTEARIFVNTQSK